MRGHDEPPNDRDELVVDTRHTALVVDTLTALPGWPGGEPARHASPELGLTRLHGLGDLAAARRAIMAGWPRERRYAIDTAERAYSDLDVVLERLREVLGGRFGGWTPTMGKNRDVDSVATAPGGGSHNPMATTDPVLPGVLPDPPSGTAGRGVRIGVLDTAVVPHAHVTASVGRGSDALIAVAEHAGAWRAWEGHAVFVAGRILVEAPAAELVTRAVPMTAAGRATSWDVAVAMARFAGAVDVLNLSLGCRTADGRAPLVLTRAADVLTPGVVLVAAAGNHGGTEIADEPVWPAALPAVTAVTSFESFGAALPWVACAARGGLVDGPYLTGPVLLRSGETVTFPGFATWSGTSFAAATASGVIAAVMTTDGVSAAEARDRVVVGAHPTVRPFEWRGQATPVTP